MGSKTTSNFVILLFLLIILSQTVIAESDLKLSYVVQPDRVNVENNIYDIFSLSNDGVVFDVFLANTGNETIENISAKLILPNVTGLNYTEDNESNIIDTFLYDNIEPDNVSNASFSFNTINLSEGTYNISLNISYIINNTPNSSLFNLILNNKDVGLNQIKAIESSPYSESFDSNFLSPLDSVILGYPVMLESKNSELLSLTVKNGKSEGIEEVNIEIIPLELTSADIDFVITNFGSINTTPENDTGNITFVNFTDEELEGLNEELFTINVITNDVAAGVYNFTLNISYNDNVTTKTTQQDLKIGIYDVDIDSTNQISQDTGITKDFDIELLIETELPNKDNFELNSSINLSTITKPLNESEINDSIKEIVENGISLYFNNTNLSHSRGAWTLNEFSLKTDGEKDLISKALLNEFEFVNKHILGSELSRETTTNLLAKEGYNALVELISESAASEAGSYYGELGLNEALTNTLFENTYLNSIKTSDITLNLPGINSFDANILLDLTDATNELPADWNFIFDEDSNYTNNGSGFGNILIDNLPMTLVLNVSGVRLAYNISNDSIPITVYVKSPNKTYLYNIDATGDFTTVDIDNIENSDYYNAVAFIDLNETDLGPLVGVSNEVVFGVEDNNPPEKTGNDVFDFISDRDMKAMNLVDEFHIEISTLEIENGVATTKSFSYDKSKLVKGGGDIVLLSTKYNDSTNQTEFTFNLSANETEVYNFTLNLSLIPKLGFKEDAELIDSLTSIVNLTANQSQTISITMDGKFGTDFNLINSALILSSGALSINQNRNMNNLASPTAAVSAIEWIGLALEVVGLASDITVKAFDEFEIQHAGKKLGSFPHTVYIGEIFKPQFIAHFVPKGFADFNEEYRAFIEVTPGKKEITKGFKGGADIKVKTKFFAPGPQCNEKDEEIKISARIQQNKKGYYSHKDLSATDSEYYTCRDFGPDGGLHMGKDRHGNYVVQNHRYYCTQWGDHKKEIDGKLDITVANPFKINSIDTDPETVNHGFQTTVTVNMEFMQHVGTTDFHVEGAGKLTLTKFPMSCGPDCTVTKANTEIKLTKNKPKDVMYGWSEHTGEHSEETETLTLKISSCSWEGEGKSQNKDFSLEGPEENITGSYDCKDEDYNFVMFNSFNAVNNGNKNKLIWKTSSEINNLGFNVLRSTEFAGPYVKINEKVIPAEREDYKGHVYTFEDKNIDKDETYYYKIQDVDTNLIKSEHGPKEAKTANTENYELEDGDNNQLIAGSNGVNFEENPVSSGDLSTQQFKIFTNSQGLYKLDKNYFESNNIDISNVDPRNIHIKLKDQEIPIFIVGEEDGSFDNQDKIIFYSKENQETYSDANVYYIWADDDSGTRMNTRDVTPAYGTSADSFENTLERYDKNYYSMMLYWPGFKHWFLDRLIAPDSKEIEFYLNDFDEEQEDMQLEITLSSEVAHYDEDPDNHLMVYLNDNLIGEEMWDGLGVQTLTYDIPLSLVNSGENKLRLELLDDMTQKLSFVRIKGFKITYQDLFMAENDELTFENQDTDQQDFELTGFDSQENYLFDIDDQSNIVFLTNFETELDENELKYKISFTDVDSEEENKYHAISIDSIKNPEYIGAYESSDIKNQNNGADYLIITYDSFAEEIEALENHRESKGLVVKTVKTSEIYDEFNFGILSPIAIKEFIVYTQENWDVSPEYILFVGDASFDYKNYLGNGIQFVPTYFIEQFGAEGRYLGQSGTDSWFADIDEDGVMDLKLGRLPGKNEVEIENMVSKILFYENDLNKGNWNSKILFAAGEGERFGEALIHAKNKYVSNKFITNNVFVEDCENIEECRTKLKNKFSSGNTLMVYNGHSGFANWAKDDLLNSQTDISEFENQGKLPFITPLTCLNSMFTDYSNGDNVVESFLNQEENKGAIGLFASAGITAQSAHEIVLDELFHNIFVEKNRELGEITLNIQKELGMNNPELHHAIQSYSLFGDPAMEIIVKEKKNNVGSSPTIMKKKPTDTEFQNTR